MNTNLLFQRLNSISFLSEAIQLHINQILQERVYSKKSILLKAGQVSNRIYFIKAGFVRAFYEQGDKTYTSWFMGSGEIIISVYSFFSRQPSFENIETLEECVVQSITWEQLQYIYRVFPEFNAVGRILTEQYYIRSEERTIHLQTLTAQQRYQKLINTYPEVLQKASLGQIASYLGIKQETLSRIRALN